MGLTQQRLAEMDEDALRTQVLVPLFEANFSIEPLALETIKKGISEKLSKITMTLTFKDKAPCRSVYPKWNPKLAEGLP